jgi:hypothetical protein
MGEGHCFLSPLRHALSYTRLRVVIQQKLSCGGVKSDPDAEDPEAKASPRMTRPVGAGVALRAAAFRAGVSCGDQEVAICSVEDVERRRR